MVASNTSDPLALAHVQTYYVFSLPEPTAAFRVVRVFLFCELFAVLVSLFVFGD